MTHEPPGHVTAPPLPNPSLPRSFLLAVLHIVFSLYFIATAPPAILKPFKVFAVRPKVPSGLVGSATLPVPLASLHFLLWFARPVRDTRAAKTDRTPGGCSTLAACIHAPIRPPPAETTHPLCPHQHKVDERTSPSPAATAWRFACLIQEGCSLHAINGNAPNPSNTKQPSARGTSVDHVE
jgi:hypothetical protein